MQYAHILQSTHFITTKTGFMVVVNFWRTAALQFFNTWTNRHTHTDKNTINVKRKQQPQINARKLIFCCCFAGVLVLQGLSNNRHHHHHRDYYSFTE